MTFSLTMSYLCVSVYVLLQANSSSSVLLVYYVKTPAKLAEKRKLPLSSYRTSLVATKKPAISSSFAECFFVFCVLELMGSAMVLALLHPAYPDMEHYVGY